ncbi:unnamed protein product [Acanthosepion pharaonis]|uniref:Uncharacterized protein n=1 Tax=Acanthosepion pharaonis TaxID=158019 RepID=A0A812ERF1_ACAPH|nr:unnamed protein product [Sepia pharaonis]
MHFLFSYSPSIGANFSNIQVFFLTLSVSLSLSLSLTSPNTHTHPFYISHSLVTFSFVSSPIYSCSYFLHFLFLSFNYSLIRSLFSPLCLFLTFRFLCFTYPVSLPLPYSHFTSFVSLLLDIFITHTFSLSHNFLAHSLSLSLSFSFLTLYGSLSLFIFVQLSRSSYLLHFLYLTFTHSFARTLHSLLPLSLFFTFFLHSGFLSHTFCISLFLSLTHVLSFSLTLHISLLHLSLLHVFLTLPSLSLSFAAFLTLSVCLSISFYLSL